jgi:hypothetical protein
MTANSTIAGRLTVPVTADQRRVSGRMARSEDLPGWVFSRE